MSSCALCRNILEQAFGIKQPRKSKNAVISAMTKSLKKRKQFPAWMDQINSNSNQSNSQNSNTDNEDDIDYSNYKGYFGKGRPVTDYAQFIHANKHRYEDNFYEYVTKCAKIWKKLSKEQREVFVDASRRDVIRYRTGKKIPREIKSASVVTKKLPDGPIKRKITESNKEVPAKKKRLSTPVPSGTRTKKAIKKKKTFSPLKRKRKVTFKAKPKKRGTLSTLKKKRTPLKKSLKKRSLSRKKKVAPQRKKKMSLKRRSSPKKGSPKSKRTSQKPKQTESPKAKSLFPCISKWLSRTSYDYSNYRPYHGKGRPVTTYAQFIHANKAHSHGEIKPFFFGCAKIWKSLSSDQKAIFKKASERDVERFHKSPISRSRPKKRGNK